MALPPASHCPQGHFGILEARELLYGLHVSRHLGRQCLGETHHRGPPRRRDHRTPALRPCRDHPRPQERGLAGPGGADEGQEPPALEPLPQSFNPGFTPEEDLGILFFERRQPGIGTARFRRLHWLPKPAVSVARDLPAEGVAEAVDGPDEAGFPGRRPAPVDRRSGGAAGAPGRARSPRTAATWASPGEGRRCRERGQPSTRRRASYGLFDLWVQDCRRAVAFLRCGMQARPVRNPESKRVRGAKGEAVCGRRCV